VRQAIDHARHGIERPNGHRMAAQAQRPIANGRRERLKAHVVIRQIASETRMQPIDGAELPIREHTDKRFTRLPCASCRDLRIVRARHARPMRPSGFTFTSFTDLTSRYCLSGLGAASKLTRLIGCVPATCAPYSFRSVAPSRASARAHDAMLKIREVILRGQHAETPPSDCPTAGSRRAPAPLPEASRSRSDVAPATADP